MLKILDWFVEKMEKVPPAGPMAAAECCRLSSPTQHSAGQCLKSKQKAPKRYASHISVFLGKSFIP